MHDATTQRDDRRSAECGERRCAPGVVYDAADSVPGVTSRLRTDDLGGSEDATYLMDRVQNHGGTATFVGIGTDHRGGHLTRLFDTTKTR